ncbi:MAG: hypothetical protein ACFFC7_30355 [Candidatus Hermodarchaeota archaeon]
MDRKNILYLVCGILFCVGILFLIVGIPTMMTISGYETSAGFPPVMRPVYNTLPGFIMTIIGLILSSIGFITAWMLSKK